MSPIKTILAEILGLFVDDGRFALAILAWLGLCRLVLPRLPALGPWAGVVLFAGLSAVLVESALRRTRK